MFITQAFEIISGMVALSRRYLLSRTVPTRAAAVRLGVENNVIAKLPKHLSILPSCLHSIMPKIRTVLYLIYRMPGVGL